VVRVTCLSAGTLRWQSGDTSFCDGPEDGAGSTHRPLEAGQHSFTITTSDDARWRLTAWYAHDVVTPLATNANGDTYGIDSPNGHPDLVAATATNHLSGYVYQSDLDYEPSFTTPAQAAAWSRKHGHEPHPIPVYESDGKTRIGTFVINAQPHAAAFPTPFPTGGR
jgi:hypothetical protein